MMDRWGLQGMKSFEQVRVARKEHHHTKEEDGVKESATATLEL